MLDYLSKAKEEGKEIIIFGSSVGGKKVEKYLLDNSVVIDAFCDNNKDVWNQIVQNHPVISPTALSKKDKDNTIIVIASNKYIDIEQQVKDLGFKEIYRNKELYNIRHNVYEKLVFPKENNPTVSILLTTYNQWEYTYNCLESLLKYKNNTSFEVIVGDNVSDDETKNIQRYIENIRVYRHKKNIHYLKNCNEIAKHSESKYILLLSNDTLMLSDNWLDKMVDYMDKDEKCGVIGALMYNHDCSFEFPGGYVNADGAIIAYENTNEIVEVQYNSPACLLVRNSLWKEIGGFNEIYFPAWFEDVDLQLSIIKKGYKVMTNQNVKYIHHGSITYGSVENPKVNERIERNRKIFLERWCDFLK